MKNINIIILLVIPFLLGATPFENPGTEIDFVERIVAKTPDNELNIFRIKTDAIDVKLVVTKRKIVVTGTHQGTFRTMNPLKTYMSGKIPNHPMIVDLIRNGYEYTYYTEDDDGNRWEWVVKFESIRHLFNNVYLDVEYYFERR